MATTTDTALPLPLPVPLPVPVLEALRHMPASLLAAARPVTLADGAALFRTGDKVRSVFLVVGGEVRLLRTGRAGNEITLQRARHGFVAEASLDALAYHCDALAAGATALRVFPVVPFRAALDAVPAFARHWRALLAKEVRQLRARCERLGLKTAEERIVHYLEAEGQAGSTVLAMTRKDWATDLGLTHEALYRALSRMARAGTLRIDWPRVALG